MSDFPPPVTSSSQDLTGMGHTFIPDAIPYETPTARRSLRLNPDAVAAPSLEGRRSTIAPFERVGSPNGVRYPLPNEKNIAAGGIPHGQDVTERRASFPQLHKLKSAAVSDLTNKVPLEGLSRRQNPLATPESSSLTQSSDSIPSPKSLEFGGTLNTSGNAADYHPCDGPSKSMLSSFSHPVGAPPGASGSSTCRAQFRSRSLFQGSVRITENASTFGSRTQFATFCMDNLVLPEGKGTSAGKAAEVCGLSSMVETAYNNLASGASSGRQGMNKPLHAPDAGDQFATNIARTMATAGDGVAMVTQFYGGGGATIEEQNIQAENDKQAPLGSADLPLGGRIRNTFLWNPFFLHAAILVVPLLFLIIASGIVIPSTFSDGDTVQSVEIANALGELVSSLVLEQRTAAILSAVATWRYTSMANDEHAFFTKWNELATHYERLQNTVDVHIAKISLLISVNEDVIRRLMQGISPWDFISLQDLSAARVYSHLGGDKLASIEQYDALIHQVVLFKGALTVEQSMRERADILRVRSISSYEQHAVATTLSLFLSYKAAASEVPGDLAPATKSDLTFLLNALAVQAVSELTFRFSADYVHDFTTTDAGLGLVDLTYVDSGHNIHPLQVPPGVTEMINTMYLQTYKTAPFDEWNVSLAFELYSSIEKAVSSVELPETKTNTAGKTLLTKDVIVQRVSLVVVLCLGVVVLLYHLLAVPTYWYLLDQHMAINNYIFLLRSSLLRMHASARMMLSLPQNEVGKDGASEAPTALRGVTPEERDLLRSFNMVRKLESFIPFPMRFPPLGTPPQALVNSDLFVRPALFMRDNLVAIQLSFLSCYTNKERLGGTMSTVRTSTGGISAMGHKDFTSSVSADNALLGATYSLSGGNTSQVTVRQVDRPRHVGLVVVLKMLCSLAKKHMPEAKRGAYVEVAGEHAVMWLNLCDDVPYPNLVAFSICANVFDECRRNGIEPPFMCVCCGSGAVGNITSYSPNENHAPMTLESCGQLWPKSAFFTGDYNAHGVRTGSDADIGVRIDRADDTIGHLDVPVSKPRHSGPARASSYSMRSMDLIVVWLKQLIFGYPTLGEEATEPLRKPVRRWRSMWARKVPTGEAESDNSEPWREVAKENAPAKSAGCLTSFTVYGEVTEALHHTLLCLRMHNIPVMANCKAARALYEEKQAYDAMCDEYMAPHVTFHDEGGLFNGGDSPSAAKFQVPYSVMDNKSETSIPAHSGAGQTGANCAKRRSHVYYSSLKHSTPGGNASRSSPNLHTCFSTSWSVRLDAREAGASSTRDDSRFFPDSVLPGGKCRLQEFQPRCVPVEMLEVSREWITAEGEAVSTLKANKGDAQRVASSTPQDLLPKDQQSVHRDGSPLCTDAKKMLRDFSKRITVRDVRRPAGSSVDGVRASAGGAAQKANALCEVQAVFAFLWHYGDDHMAYTMRTAEFSTSRFSSRMESTGYQPGSFYEGPFKVNNTTANVLGMPFSLDQTAQQRIAHENEILNRWEALFDQYARFCYALVECEPSSRRLTSGQSQKLLLLSDAVEGAIQSFASSSSRCKLTEVTEARMMDVISVVRKFLNKGPLPLECAVQTPLSVLALEYSCLFGFLAK